VKCCSSVQRGVSILLFSLLAGLLSSVTASTQVETPLGGGQLALGIPLVGTSFGDTHLTTFFGVHYDFQASGEFVLVQADPGLVVQTRQKSWSPPSVSINTGVSTKMGNTRVAVCLTGLEVNGAPTQLDDGKSLSLADGVMVSRTGDAYVVSRPNGANVKAEISGGAIHVSVVLGATSPNTVHGLLGGQENKNRDLGGDLVMNGGTVLKRPPTFDEFRRYADSWRVDPADSLLCGGGKVQPGMPTQPIYAGDLPPQERERVRAICRRAGVKEGPHFDDCMLDVSLLGDDSAATVFVNAPVPISVIRPLP
jgi:hypothetical protein